MRVFVSQLPGPQALTERDLLTLARLADSLGFDGVGSVPGAGRAGGNPHTSLLQAGILARETSRVKIAVLDCLLPTMPSPVQTADQLAWLQQVSNERLIAGFGLGGVDQYEQSRLNPASASERFRETLRLMNVVWRGEQPERFDGAFWTWHLPQRTTLSRVPPVWTTGPAEKDFFDLAVPLSSGYVLPALIDAKTATKGAKGFRKAFSKQRPEADAPEVVWQVPIFVGETDDSAWNDFSAWLEPWQQTCLRDAFREPPGLFSPRTIAKQAKLAEQSLATLTDREAISAGHFALVGSPESVQEQLTAAIDSIEPTTLVGLFQFGQMPLSAAQENIRRFAKQLLPSI